MEDMNEENNISSNSKSAGRRYNDLRKKRIRTLEESKEKSSVSNHISSEIKSPFRRNIS